VEDVVILFCHVERLGQIGNRVPSVVWGFLRQDHSGGKVGSISFKLERAFAIRVDEDWSRGETVFQVFEGSVPLVGPREQDVFLCEVIERSGHGSEVFDEPSVEVFKAKK
ncbi:hypothetical protein HETIRDRAFT_317982, partial [Heterobasidion irregulare TC 32-1]